MKLFKKISEMYNDAKNAQVNKMAAEAYKKAYVQSVGTTMDLTMLNDRTTEELMEAQKTLSAILDTVYDGEDPRKTAPKVQGILKTYYGIDE